MSSISQGLVIATAMVVSSTALFLAFSKNNNDRILLHTHNKSLRSCLSSGGKRKTKKKKVRFAEDVKEPSGNGEKYRKERRNNSCRNEIKGIPANRVALYNGILKQRLQRIECSS